MMDVERLLSAAMAGDVDAVNHLIVVNNMPPDASNAAGFTPLIVAAQAGRASIVQALLQKHKALPDLALSTGMTALTMAAHKGHAQIARALCDHGARAPRPNGKTALTIAIEEGHPDVVDALLDCNGLMDDHASTQQPPLHLAACHGQTEIARRLLSRDPGVAAITAASSMGVEHHGSMVSHGSLHLESSSYALRKPTRSTPTK